MRVYILAATYRDAEWIAHKRQLKPSGWVYLNDGMKLRGTRGATVLMTPDWGHRRSFTDCYYIQQAVKASQANVIRVERG